MPDGKVKRLQISGLLQSDWAQNDENAIDYVKNRTHYITAENIRVPYAEDIVTAFDDLNYRYLNINITSLGLEEKIVIITINGKEYTDIAKISEGRTVINCDNDYLITQNATELEAIIENVEPGMEYNIKIEVIEEAEKVVQLDEKYIPESIARVEDLANMPQADWNESNLENPGYIKNRTHYDERYIENPAVQISATPPFEEIELPSSEASVAMRIGNYVSTFPSIGEPYVSVFAIYENNNNNNNIEYYKEENKEGVTDISATINGFKALSHLILKNCPSELAEGDLFFCDFFYVAKTNLAAQALFAFFSEASTEEEGLIIWDSYANAQAGVYMLVPAGTDHGNVSKIEWIIGENFSGTLTTLNKKYLPYINSNILNGAGIQSIKTDSYGNTADGNYSAALGYKVKASGDYQTVIGGNNIEDTTSSFIIGNGSYFSSSNAHTLDKDGNAWFAGDVYVGSTSGTNKDEGSKKLLTEDGTAFKANYAGEQYASNSMLRNSQLVSTETTPTVNGEICWQYE